MLPGIIALIVGNFLGAAINPTFVKLSIQDVPPFLFTTLRFIVASVAFYPLYRHLKTRRLGRGHIRELTRYTVFHSGNILLFVIGIPYTTVLMSMIFYALTPIMVGLFSHFFTHEKLTGKQIVGAIIAFMGIGFLFLQSLNKNAANTFGTPFGNVLMLLAAVSLALYYVYSRRLMKTYDVVATSLYSYVLTGVLSALVVPFELGVWHKAVHFTPIAVMSILLVGIGGSAAMLYLTQYGIKHTNAFIGSVFLYLGPLFAAVTAIPLLHEKVTTNLIIGGTLILFGVFYATSSASVFRRNTAL
jgi:drug/metabolite transporter (DMT)-like permease